MKRRDVLKTIGVTSMAFMASSHLPLKAQPIESKPNFVIIFTDDQGYGDLGCFGSKTIRSPRLDKFAEEGTRFTDCYAQVVCGPSRSALLTGRYPVRSAGWSMPETEITIGEVLQKVGYATACIGKWDVSNRKSIKGRIPNDQGFDNYWGPLGANDSGSVTLYENRKKLGKDNNMASLTKRYTDKGIEFIKKNKDRPFFLYLSHTMVHSKIDASPEFRGKSKGGLYGDTVEELDFHTGRLLDAIDRLDLRNNTIVIFTSDNGPWSNYEKVIRAKHNGEIATGSSGVLREGKGSTYEGGIRVPCIIRWPGHMPTGCVNNAIVSTLDFLPTFAALAGGEMPADRIIDGVDQSELFLGKSKNGLRRCFLYFSMHELHGIRKGDWKLLLPNREKFSHYVKDKGTKEAELYDLESDIGEKNNLAKQHPEIVEELMEEITKFIMPKELPKVGIR